MFRMVKEIKSKNGVLHFRRWRIVETPWFNIYIHKIYQPDEDHHLHNHPFSFLTIILSGKYFEQGKKKGMAGSWMAILRAGSFAWRWYDWYHKIIALGRDKWGKNIPVTTLVITGPRRGTWGYLVKDEHMNHQEYRECHENLS